LFLECALGAGHAIAVDIGVADDMRGEAGLRIEPIRLTIDGEARLANVVDGLHQLRRRATAQVIKGLVRPQHGEIGRRVLLRHQPGQGPGQLKLAADHLFRVKRDGPGIDRSGQRMAFAIDDVPAVGNQRRNALLAAGMIAEGSEPQDAQDDEGNDPAIDDHREHQALVHDRQDLAPLSDETEPLGPCDESGRGRVHRAALESLGFAGVDLGAPPLADA